MSLLSMKIDKVAETMTIVLGLEKMPKASKSGKSLVVADSGGSTSTGTLVKGKDVYISAVAYIKK